MLEEKKTYLPTLFFMSHWLSDSDLAGKVDGVTQEYFSYDMKRILFLITSKGIEIKMTLKGSLQKKN